MGPKKKKGEGEGGKGKSSKLTKMNEMDRVKYLERRFLFIKHFNSIHMYTVKVIYTIATNKYGVYISGCQKNSSVSIENF